MLRKVSNLLLILLVFINISVPLHAIDLAHAGMSEAISLEDISENNMDPTDNEKDENTTDAETVCYVANLHSLEISLAQILHKGKLSTFVSSFIQKFFVPPSL